MFLRSFVYFLIVVGVGVWASCSTDKAAEMVPANDTSCIQAGQVITYVSDIQAILTTYCGTDGSFGSCHQPVSSGGSGFDYTTYAGIFAEYQTGILETRVFIIGDMPYFTTTGPQELSACDAEKLQAWMDAGAPEN